MPSPSPSLVAREDVAGSADGVSDSDELSGKMGTTVGTEGVVVVVDGDGGEDKDDEWVREDAIMEMVVVIGVPVDGMLGVVIVSGCEVVTDPEDSPMLLAVVSGQDPPHVGGVTGVMTGTDTTDELVLTHVL